jgi:hypothetical protein
MKDESMKHSIMERLRLCFKRPYDNLKIRHKLFLLQSLVAFIFGTISLVAIQIALN